MNAKNQPLIWTKERIYKPFLPDQKHNPLIQSYNARWADPALSHHWPTNYQSPSTTGPHAFPLFAFAHQTSLFAVPNDPYQAIGPGYRIVMTRPSDRIDGPTGWIYWSPKDRSTRRFFIALDASESMVLSPIDALGIENRARWFHIRAWTFKVIHSRSERPSRSIDPERGRFYLSAFTTPFFGVTALEHSLRRWARLVRSERDMNGPEPIYGTQVYPPTDETIQRTGYHMRPLCYAGVAIGEVVPPNAAKERGLEPRIRVHPLIEHVYEHASRVPFERNASEGAYGYHGFIHTPDYATSRVCVLANGIGGWRTYARRQIDPKRGYRPTWFPTCARKYYPFLTPLWGTRPDHLWDDQAALALLSQCGRYGSGWWGHLWHDPRGHPIRMAFDRYALVILRDAELIYRNTNGMKPRTAQIHERNSYTRQELMWVAMPDRPFVGAQIAIHWPQPFWRDPYG